MYKLLIFGTKEDSAKVVDDLNLEEAEILAFVNNENIEGDNYLEKKVISLDDIKKYCYDYILIAGEKYSEMYMQLVNVGVDQSKIVQCTMDKNSYRRTKFFKDNKEKCEKISSILIFGTGSGSIKVLDNLNLDKVKILAFIDNNREKYGSTYHNRQVISPNSIKEYEYDYILIASQVYSKIYRQLINLGVNQNKIMQCFMDENSHNKTFLLNSDYDLFSNKAYEKLYPYSAYSPWNLDMEFRKVYRKVTNNTLVDKYRSYELWNLAEQCSHLDGDILEVGVWRGGTGAIICKKLELLSSDKTVYLADTFCGVVKTSEKDSWYVGGEHSNTSQAIVEKLLNNKVKVGNYNILKGIFPDDTGKFVEDKKFCFCHIDVDVYKSAKDIVNWIWDRMCVGAIIVFDDYGTEDCDGIAKYLDEMKKFDDRVVIYNLNGHGIMVKVK